MSSQLSEDYHNPIQDLLREVESTSRLLRDLHDFFPVYRSRLPIVVYYLTVVLPCLCKTLREMLPFLEADLPVTTQWVLMNERMSERGGMAIATRFVMYENPVQTNSKSSKPKSRQELETQ